MAIRSKSMQPPATNITSNTQRRQEEYHGQLDKVDNPLFSDSFTMINFAQSLLSIFNPDAAVTMISRPHMDRFYLNKILALEYSVDENGGM
jgi:hypothetical protein